MWEGKTKTVSGRQDHELTRSAKAGCLYCVVADQPHDQPQPEESYSLPPTRAIASIVLLYTFLTVHHSLQIIDNLMYISPDQRAIAIFCRVELALRCNLFFKITRLPIASIWRERLGELDLWYEKAQYRT